LTRTQTKQINLFLINYNFKKLYGFFLRLKYIGCLAVAYLVLDQEMGNIKIGNTPHIITIPNAIDLENIDVFIFKLLILILDSERSNGNISISRCSVYYFWFFLSSL